MTKEDKQHLYKDLCMRLPYHPQIHICNDSWEGMMIGEFDNTLYSHHLDAFWCDRIEILPYLRPMSSMTDEERLYFHRNSARVQILVDEEKLITKPFYGYTIHLFDWLNANHFDYHNLIGKSLAFEAPEGMYYSTEK